MKNIFQKEKEALVLEKSGDWDGAHQIVQRLETTEAQRIHAYLHRKEGDLSNAAYWYARAGVEKCSGSFDAEWEMLKELVR